MERNSIVRVFLLACLALPLLAAAQSKYPAKPIRVVVPAPAGSSPDIVVRLWGDRVSRATGQPVVVENKPGATTIIGAQAVATAPADGYTLLYTVNNTLSINPFVFSKLPYKAEDFAPVIRILSVPYILVVPASSPVRTLGDLIAEAKAKPGKMSYGSYGIGQGTHVAMARLVREAGVSMTHVPYNSMPVNDLIAGRIDVLFDASTTAVPLIKAGKLRGLAVSGAKRVDAVPDIPTVAESFPGFVGDSWQGILAPKGTPAEVIATLSTLSQKIVDTEDFRARLHDYGLVPVGGTPEDFQKFLAEDARRWARVVKENDIKVE